MKRVALLRMATLYMYISLHYLKKTFILCLLSFIIKNHPGARKHTHTQASLIVLPLVSAYSIYIVLVSRSIEWPLLILVYSPSFQYQLKLSVKITKQSDKPSTFNFPDMNDYQLRPPCKRYCSKVAIYHLIKAFNIVTVSYKK